MGSLIFQDSHLSKEDRNERLEQMIRKELEENFDRQTPVQSLLTDGSVTTSTSLTHSQTSLRNGTHDSARARPSSGIKPSQY